MPRIVGSVALPTELRLHLVVALAVHEVVTTQRVVAVGATHQQPLLGDGGQDPDVVLTILRAFPFEITGRLVPSAARPQDSLQQQEN